MKVSEAFGEQPKKPRLCENCGTLCFTSAEPSARVTCLDCDRARHERSDEQYTWDDYNEYENRQDRLTKYWLGSKR